MKKYLLLLMLTYTVGLMAVPVYTPAQIARMATKADPANRAYDFKTEAAVLRWKKEASLRGLQLGLGASTNIRDSYSDNVLESAQNRFRVSVTQDIVGLAERWGDISRASDNDLDWYEQERTSRHRLTAYRARYTALEYWQAGNELDLLQQGEKLAKSLYNREKRRYYYGQVASETYDLAARNYHEMRSQLDEAQSRRLVQKSRLCDYLGVADTELTIVADTLHSLPTWDFVQKNIKIPDVTFLRLQEKQKRYDNKREYKKQISLNVYGAYNLWFNSGNNYNNGGEVGINARIPLSLRAIGAALEESDSMLERQVRADSLVALREKTKLIYDLYETARKEQLRLQRSSDYRLFQNTQLQFNQQRDNAIIPRLNASAVDSLTSGLNLVKARLEEVRASAEMEKALLNIAYEGGMELEQFPPADKATNAQANQRGLWVWKADNCLAEPLLAICHREGITTVYLSFSAKTLLSGSSGIAARLISTLQDGGLDCQLLLSENSWVNNRGNLSNLLQSITAWQDSLPAPSRVSALHFDIEPHTLPGWKDNQSMFLNNLIDLYDYINLTVHLPVVADLPVFYDTIMPGFYPRFLPLVSGVNLMAYETTDFTRILSGCYDELEAADNAGKRVVVGLREQEFDSRDKRDDIFNRLNERLRLFDSFSGFALHDYQHLVGE